MNSRQALSGVEGMVAAAAEWVVSQNLEAEINLTFSRVSSGDQRGDSPFGGGSGMVRCVAESRVLPQCRADIMTRFSEVKY